ncbi:3'-5' exonuclease [Paraliomyxa miuraensis]|uniref:3'-5' exonuclease n=1 Tax=Paraliomyxa miuraensis TaxID=376150 RepID=UPI002255E182|nr:3'-5' exonuclease [Paraliomyxa miuraensis]MCX4239769.1 AAA family ATPase [Paraliomyxa miuraensis]
MAVMFADTFFLSVGKLEPRDQARAIDFVNRFQANPANPGTSLERLTGRSRDLWSGRITRDLRCILHQDGEHWALLYADHHDEAYRWAERRRVGRHPVTGIIQVVETVEAVPEVQRVVEAAPADAPLLLEAHDDAYLLSLGVPEDWLPTLRKVVDEDQLLVVIDKLPPDVAERLLALAAGDLPTPPAPVAADAPLLDHPDVRRRFFVSEDSDELLRALEAPMERWIAFLHPSQRALVEGDYKGPVKVSGSAGTGKTVVAMHRARHLARQGQRVLLTSFVKTLCKNIEQALGILCSPTERERITVSTVHAQALSLLRRVEPRIQPASESAIDDLLVELQRREAPGFSLEFVRSEWSAVVQAQGLRTWAEYRTARRTGRGTPLSTSDRKTLWKVFTGVHARLASTGLLDWPGVCRKVADRLEAGELQSPFDAVIVDEVQDLSPPELRLVAASCAEHPGHLMVVGDVGQRIYPGGGGLSKHGIAVRGRSHVLELNYRTTEQIRRTADRMLGVIDDEDQDRTRRDRTRSLLRGPTPVLQGYANVTQEHLGAVERVRAWISEGLQPEELAVFARTKRVLDEVDAALHEAGVPTRRLADDERPPRGVVRLGTMHRAKGLEFKAVLLVGCTRGQVPSEGLLRHLGDPQDREQAEDRERRLLYVAMTRARDELMLSWAGAPSPFLDGLSHEGGPT